MSLLFVQAFGWIENNGSKPIIGGTVILLMVTSIALAIWSSTGAPLLLCDGHGRLWGCAWDPGALYSNAIQNALQLVLLFATMALAYSIRDLHTAAHISLHEKIAAIKAAVDALSEDDTV